MLRTIDLTGRWQSGTEPALPIAMSIGCGAVKLEMRNGNRAKAQGDRSDIVDVNKHV
jgi:hypothetical protein